VYQNISKDPGAVANVLVILATLEAEIVWFKTSLGEKFMRPHLNQQMLGILDWRYGSSARESTKP
jgi:hypothetical protein